MHCAEKSQRTVQILKFDRNKGRRGRCRRGRGRRSVGEDRLRRRNGPDGIGTRIASKSRYLPFKNIGREKPKRPENTEKVLVQLMPQDSKRNQGQTENKEKDMDNYKIESSIQKNKPDSDFLRNQQQDHNHNKCPTLNPNVNVLNHSSRNLEEFCYNLPVVFDFLPESNANAKEFSDSVEPGQENSLHTIPVILEKTLPPLPQLESLSRIPTEVDNPTLVDINDVDWFPHRVSNPSFSKSSATNGSTLVPGKEQVDSFKESKERFGWESRPGGSVSITLVTEEGNTKAKYQSPENLVEIFRIPMQESINQGKLQFKHHIKK